MKDHMPPPKATFSAQTRQSKDCGFCIYIFDNSKSKSMVRLVRAEKMVWSSLVFARKIDSQDDFDSEYTGFDGSPDD